MSRDLWWSVVIGAAVTAAAAPILSGSRLLLAPIVGTAAMVGAAAGFTYPSVLRSWRERRRIVLIPDGHQSGIGGRGVLFVSPPVVALEEVHAIHATPERIRAASTGSARLVRRRAGFAQYRVSEALHGRDASGHWIADREGNMVLRAICLVSQPGFPIPPSQRSEPK